MVLAKKTRVQVNYPRNQNPHPQNHSSAGIATGNYSIMSDISQAQPSQEYQSGLIISEQTDTRQ